MTQGHSVPYRHLTTWEKKNTHTHTSWSLHFLGGQLDPCICWFLDEHAWNWQHATWSRRDHAKCLNTKPSYWELVNFRLRLLVPRAKPHRWHAETRVSHRWSHAVPRGDISLRSSWSTSLETPPESMPSAKLGSGRKSQTHAFFHVQPLNDSDIYITQKSCVEHCETIGRSVNLQKS